MGEFIVSGRRIEFGATLVLPKASTSDVRAWHVDEYVTVRMLQADHAIRVHTEGRSYPGRNGSASSGLWVAIGDVIQTSGQLASSRSLPTANPNSATAFTHVNAVTIPAGCVLNIGIASAKFGGRGGGFQGEYVSGPLFKFTPLVGKHWHGRAGSA